MKKTFMMEDLDCAHCAGKMEDGIKKLAGVKSASVNFLAKKMVIDADDDCFESIVDKAVKLCKKIEPDCVIIRK